MDSSTRTLEQVKEYYGQVLNTNKDLKTNACCPTDSLPGYLSQTVNQIHMEVREKFYGCGVNIPLELEGRTILDLGCGTGRDCYLFSKLVGETGSVIGIDMTDEQLSVANKHVDYHREQFGHQRSNVRFTKGYIEELEEAGIESNSIDVVISNCVINLSPNKERVFKEIFRVLKPGGELYFSDVFTDRRLPKAAQEDSVLLGECLGGAMYIEDFRRMLLEIGVRDYRIVSQSPINILDESTSRKVGLAKFSSLSIRAFKVDVEDRCEDYGQVAYYLGTIVQSPNSFELDDHHLFETNRPMLVCSNTASMLSQSRYGKHFRIEGNLDQHFGLFPCGPEASTTTSTPSPDIGAACC